MRATILLALAVFLAACAPKGAPQSYEIVKACEAYEQTLRSLAIRRGDLSDQQVALVNDARALANPICYSDSPVGADDRGQVERAMDMLIKAKKGTPND